MCCEASTPADHTLFIAYSYKIIRLHFNLFTSQDERKNSLEKVYSLIIVYLENGAMVSILVIQTTNMFKSISTRTAHMAMDSSGTIIFVDLVEMHYNCM